MEILKDEGCTDIYLFGSLAHGDYRENSDIDLVIIGCPPDKFFYLIGKLLMELHHNVDLINIDRQDSFSDYLINEGDLIHVI